MTDSVRPDEVIPPEGGGSLQLRTLVTDIALLVPNLIKLLGRLVRDPRVPRRSKLLVGAMLAYLGSPVDVVPDFVPGLGKVDDILLLALAVDHLFDKAGEDVVMSHWDGPADLLQMVRTVIDATAQLVPAPVRRWVERLSS